MDLFKAIEERYSYRGSFKDEIIPVEALIRIAKAGCMAPSGKNAQTTEFIIVNDDDTLKKIKDIFPGKKFIETAVAHIICIIDKEPEKIFHGYHFQLEDCAAAVENMLLAITASGYASVWIDGMLRIESKAEKLGELLNIPANKKAQVLLPVGIPAEDYPRKEKLPFEKRVKFNSY